MVEVEVEVRSEESVEVLICRMEDTLGGENLYRIIYAGKMMHEGEMLSKYAMIGQLPVVVMMTKLEVHKKAKRRQSTFLFCLSRLYYHVKYGTFLCLTTQA